MPMIVWHVGGRLDSLSATPGCPPMALCIRLIAGTRLRLRPCIDERDGAVGASPEGGRGADEQERVARHDGLPEAGKWSTPRLVL